MTRSPGCALARARLWSLVVAAVLAVTGCDWILEQLPGDDGGSPDPLPVLSIAAAPPVEEGGTLTFPVELSKASDVTVTAYYSIDEQAGTALAGTDYEPVSDAKVTLAPGVRRQVIEIRTLGDQVEEGSETLKLRLTEVRNARLGTAAATGTILGDDDTQALAVPIMPGVYRARRLETRDDVDYFRVVIPVSGAVIAATDRGQADAPGNKVHGTVVRVEHDGGNARFAPLELDHPSLDGALVTVAGPDPATIYIKVSGDAATAYDLAVWVIERPEVPWFFGDETEDSFDIELRYVGDQPTAAQKAVIRQAADVWEGVITQGVPDRFISSSSVICDVGDPSLFGAHIDDLVVYVKLHEMDGVGGTLAQAGPCMARTPGYLPYLGIVILDVDDLRSLHRAGVLGRIMTHEIGHALGLGTIWHQVLGPDGRPLLRQPSLENGNKVPGRDTSFSGRAARAAFDSVGGRNYRRAKVPVENDTGDYGAGALDAHWRESVFDAELMTSMQLAERGSREPLSLVTVAALQDIGYAVDETAAEPYTLPPPERTAAGSLARSEGPVIHLVGDVRDAPFMTEDPGTVPRAPAAFE